MRRLWDRLWFAPESWTNIAAARAIFALHAIWVLLSHDLPAMSGLPPAFWAATGLGARLRFLIVPGHPQIEYATQWLTIALLLCAASGLRPAWTCFASGLLLYHLAPLETLFWSTNPYERGLTIDILALLTLAAAGRKSTNEEAPGWSLRLAQFHLASIYLLAGISKLRRVGPAWASGENQRRWLVAFAEETQLRVFKSVGPWLASHMALCWVIGVTALLLDLFFVVAVFSRRSRWILVPLAVAGHIGILLSLNIFFINLPQLLVFVNWEALRGFFRAARLARESPESPSTPRAQDGAAVRS